MSLREVGEEHFRSERGCGLGFAHPEGARDEIARIPGRLRRHCQNDEHKHQSTSYRKPRPDDHRESSRTGPQRDHGDPINLMQVEPVEQRVALRADAPSSDPMVFQL